MTLLQEIQQLAVDSSVDLDSILRKCLILASRLRQKELKTWVRSELDGYSSDNLPDYRTFSSFAQGHFSGAFGRQVKNANIPETHIPKELRDILQIKVTQSVSEIQDMIADATEGRLMKPWPASLYTLFDGIVFEDMSLLSAWTVIPKNKFVGVLNTVRNRILSFALEMEEEYPEAGETDDSKPLPEEKITKLFTTNIYGTIGNFAAGSTVGTMSANIIESGNFDSLSTYLSSIGIDASLVADLKKAIEKDPLPKDDSLGKHVSKWFGKIMTLAAQGAFKIATGSIASVITHALMQYYASK